MMQKLLILIISLMGITAFGMDVYPEKLGNPWVQVAQNNVVQVDPDTLPLFNAIGSEDAVSVHALITERPLLLQARNAQGQTPLHYAANFHSVDVVRTILDLGASIDADSPYGTPLHLAASEGELSIVELLLARGADINARDPWGRAPLFDAIYDLHYDVTAFLLQRGAGCIRLQDGTNTIIQDNMGRTPLHTAVIRLNELVHYGNKCKLDPITAMQSPDKYFIRYLFLQHEKKCLAKLLFMHLNSHAEMKDRLDKSAYDYERLAKVLPLSESKIEKVKSSFLPASLPVRKTPPVKSKKNKNKYVVHKTQSAPAVVRTLPIVQEQQEEPVVVKYEPQVVLQEEVEEPACQVIETSCLYAGYTPNRFAQRVLDWFAHTKASALLAAGSGWWHTRSVHRELQYHQIPFDIIHDVMQFGNRELRDHATRSHKDVSWRMHGCMEFYNGMDNPWCQGKTKQEGFYHCTQGRDGKIYHIGFDPIQEGAFLTSYFPESFLRETIKTKIYDKEKGVLHTLYA